MREKLNDNPIAQIGVVSVLLVAAAFLLLTTMHGGSEGAEEASSPSVEAAVAAVESELGPGEQPAALPAPGTGVGAAPPLPRPVVAAFHANQTVVVLFVRNGGIDDRLVLRSVDRLDALPGVRTFVVPARHLARYVSIAQGVSVNRVPALVVVRPKDLDKSVPTASVHYGFQSPESVVQAVVDAGYEGRSLPYHP